MFRMLSDNRPLLSCLSQGSDTSHRFVKQHRGRSVYLLLNTKSNLAVVTGQLMMTKTLTPVDDIPKKIPEFTKDKV